MADSRTTTAHLGLVQPQYNEDADIKDINDNMDIIDSHIYILESRNDTFQTTEAPAFDVASAYSAGSYVIYENELYLLPSGHEANVTWANTTKTKKTITGLINEISQSVGAQIDDTAGEGVTNKTWSANKITSEVNATIAIIAPTFAQGTAYESGSYVVYNNELYYLANGHTAGTAWADTTKSKKTVGEMLEYLLENAGAQIDDTAGIGTTDKVWSANKAESEIDNIIATIAPTFNQATAYGNGAYVEYNKQLYCLPNGHLANLPWANTTKTLKTISEVLGELKNTVITDDGNGNVTIY